MRVLSKIITFTKTNIIDMPDKLKKLIHLVAMMASVLAIVVFGVIHALTALDSQYGGLLMIVYVVMFIWAVCRVVVLMKEYHRMK